MPHKPWNLLLSFWATSLAWAIVALFTLAADSNAQEILRPYAPPLLHSFLDSANVYPESVTVDQSSGTSSKLPDEYGYLASEWSGQIEVPIVLLEKIH